MKSNHYQTSILIQGLFFILVGLANISCGTEVGNGDAFPSGKSGNDDDDESPAQATETDDNSNTNAPGAEGAYNDKLSSPISSQYDFSLKSLGSQKNLLALLLNHCHSPLANSGISGNYNLKIQSATDSSLVGEVIQINTGSPITITHNTYNTAYQYNVDNAAASGISTVGTVPNTYSTFGCANLKEQTIIGIKTFTTSLTLSGTTISANWTHDNQNKLKNISFSAGGSQVTLQRN